MKIHSENRTYYRHEYGLEKDFETQLHQAKHQLFPDCYFERWDPLLVDSLSKQGVKPDGILISSDFTSWWVVEVELAREKKKRHIIDQLGKLERVDYSVHKVQVESTLAQLGISDSKQISRDLVSEPPGLILIMDKQDASIREIASERGFSVVVTIPYRSDCGRVLLVNEGNHSTNFSRNDGEILFTLSANRLNRKKLDTNNWWYPIKKPDFLSSLEKIQIIDGEGSFPAPIDLFGGTTHMRLPKNRRSVLEILKGNRIGELKRSEISGQFILTTRWKEI